MLAANNQPAATEDPTGDASGFHTILGSAGATVPAHSQGYAGAYATQGDVSSSQLTLLGNVGYDMFGTQTKLLAGGYTADGKAKGNTLVVRGSTSGSTPTGYGGYSTTGDAVANVIRIESQASFRGRLEGGHSSNGNANSNRIEIQAEGSASGDIYGGRVDSNNGGAAENNSVLIAGAASGSLYGGATGTGDACGNVVAIEAGASYSGSSIYGGRSNSSTSRGSGIVSGNQIEFAGTASGTSLTILGGYSDRGNASDNSIVIKDTAKIQTTGSLRNEYIGARSREGDVVDNTVIMLTSDENALIYGGYAEDGKVAGNRVVIGENVHVASVYGGYGGFVTDEAKNEVELHDGAVVTGVVFATKPTKSYSSDPAYPEASGTITVSGSVQAGAVKGFDKLILNISEANAGMTGTAVLTLTGASSEDVSDDLVLNHAVVEIRLDENFDEAASYKLIDLTQEGQRITFDESTTFEKTGTFVDTAWNFNAAADGTVIETTEDLLLVDGNLVAGDTIIAGTKTANTNSKTLAESFLGSIAFVSQGAEFIADEGMRAIANAAAPDRVTSFGAIHGGFSRYKTGSRVDLDGVTLAAGVAGKFGQLTAAGFIEAGWASSESHVSGTKGDGDHDYYGLGAAAKFEFESNFYLDGSVRLGMASTEFDGRYGDASAKYNADSFYLNFQPVLLSPRGIPL